MRTLFCLLLLGTLALNAAELTGKWSGTFDVTNPDGDTKQSTAYMDLKEADGVVTGTAGPSAEEQWPLRKGKLDGKKLTFDVETEHGIISFELSFDGESISGTASGTGDGGEKLSAKLNLKRTS
jgi:hypothetical protein